MRKRTKYEKQTMSTGEKCRKVVPLVFEHFGLWGEEAYDYLKELAKSSRDSEGRKNVADFLMRWRRQLAINIQRCNARVILNNRKFTCRLAEDTLEMCALIALDNFTFRDVIVFIEDLEK